jgi:hypothetical protein
LKELLAGAEESPKERGPLPKPIKLEGEGASAAEVVLRDREEVCPKGNLDPPILEEAEVKDFEEIGSA